METWDWIEFAQEPDIRAWRQSKVLLKASPETGFPKMKELAEQGSLLAMPELGRAYTLGLGVPRDDREAEKWFKAVAATRSVHGHYYLGRFFLRTRRFAEAHEAMRFSAARGYAPALHDLAKLHLHGKGVDRDIAMAMSYLERASKAGSVMAKRRLAGLILGNSKGARAKLNGLRLMAESFVGLIGVLLRYGPTSERLLP